MKILLLSNKSPWPPMDGGSSATMSMIKGLAATGASVTVLAFNTTKHFTDVSRVPGTYSRFLFVDLDSRIRPLPLICNLLFSPAPYTLSRFRNEHFSKVLSLLLEEHFDIVQIEGLAMSWYLPVVRKYSSARVIFRPHNVESNIWNQLAGEEKNIARKIYFRITARKTRKLESMIMNDFDGVAAMTEKDMDWFIEAGCTKPCIASAPAPDIFDQSHTEMIPHSACFIGALDWRPNINALKWLVKEVWPVVVRTIPEATLHIAGRNPGKKIRKICSGKSIVFTGETESSSEFLRNKEVMAVPLFSGSGIRMKILEGMALGKCIVATPAAAAGTIFENKKNIFIESDSTGFAERIISLMRDENLRLTTGISAGENVRKNYNILASAESLLKFYTRLA